MKSRPASSAEATRQALVTAALSLFGEYGYDAVSTRQIADDAAANIGSIAYHFGGKAGLRLACAQHVIQVLKDEVGPALSRPIPIGTGAEQAEDMLQQILGDVIRTSYRRKDADVLFKFVTRELVEPGEVMNHLYADLIGPMHARFCDLFGIAIGRQDQGREVTLTAFTLIAQAMFFRLCKPIVMKRMGWFELGEEEVEAAAQVFAANLRAVIADHRAR